jgi:hypothetical protein
MTQYPAGWIVRDPEHAQIGHVIPLQPAKLPEPGPSESRCANCNMDPPGEMLGWYLCPNAYKQKFFEIDGKPWIILGRLIKTPCPVCNRLGDDRAGGRNFQQAPDQDGDQEKYTDH